MRRMHVHGDHLDSLLKVSAGQWNTGSEIGGIQQAADTANAQLKFKCSHGVNKEKRVAAFLLQPVDFIGGVDGTRTRDPRRDRPVF